MGLVGTLIWKGGMKITGILAKANGFAPKRMSKGEEFLIYPRIYPQRDIAREKADLLHKKGFGVIMEHKKGKRMKGYCLYVKRKTVGGI